MLFAYYLGKNLIPLREQGNKAKFWTGTREQTKKKQGNMGTLTPPPWETLCSHCISIANYLFSSPIAAYLLSITYYVLPTSLFSAISIACYLLH